MGRFLIFIGVTLLLCLIGLGVWWLGNLIWIKIRRAEKKFEIEEEGYDLAKESIRKDTEEPDRVINMGTEWLKYHKQ